MPARSWDGLIRGRTLQFQALDYHDYHDYSCSPEAYNILIFGRTANDQDVCLKVTDYQPFFYLELPKGIDDDTVEACIERTRGMVRFLCDKKEEIDEDLSDTLIGWEYQKRIPFMGFTAGRRKTYLKLSLTSLRGMRVWAQAFNREIKLRSGERVRMNICESNMDPYIRAIHARDLVSCGWIDVPVSAMIPSPRLSRCDISASVHWEELTASANQSRMAPFKILGYDIECVSCDRGFPQANRPQDQVIQIGLTLYRMGSMDCERKWLLNLGPCSSIEGAEVIICQTEQELFLEWARLMNEIRPDLIVGHNIFGFDDRYIKERMDFYDREEAQKMGIDVADLPTSLLYRFRMSYGKLRNRQLMADECLDDSPTVFRHQPLSSSAMGDNDLYYFRVPGIVPIDSLKYMRREYSYLDSYALDSVASVFISSGVKDYQVKGNRLHIITETCGGLRENDYIQLMVDHGYFNMPIDDSKYQVMRIVEEEKGYRIVVRIPREHGANLEYMLSTEKVLWAMAKDDMPYNKISQYFYEGDADGMAMVGKYCLQDCALVNILLAKLLTVMNSIIMANVCSVPLYYIFVRGQGPKNMSLVLKFTASEGYVLPVLPRLEHAPKFQGAVVVDPKPGIYQDTIAVLDYKSLYPSSIRQKNLSPDSHVADSKLMGLDGYIYHHVSMDELDDDKKVVYDQSGNPVQREYWFAQEIVTEEQMLRELEPVYQKIRDKYKDRHPSAGHVMTAADVAIWYKCPHAEGDVLDSDGVAQLEKVIQNKIQWEQTNERKKNYNYTKGHWVRYAIIPRILGILLMEREAAKREMAAATDSFTESLHNARQLALKVTANSIYGLTGARTSKIYYLPVASSTTAVGRELLYFAKDTVEREYPGAVVVYGDTDSIFINFNIRNADGSRLPVEEERVQAIKLAKNAEELINLLIDSPQEIEYEKSFSPLILISKKRYVGVKYLDTPVNGKITAMGMALRRRDYAPIAKKVLTELIQSILVDGDSQRGVNTANALLHDVLNGKYDIKHFSLRKALRANYKGTPPAHRILANRMAARDPGNAPQANDRIPYVHIQVPVEREKDAKSGDRIETPEYVQEKGLKIDYMYYIDRRIKKVLGQIMELMMEPQKVESIFTRLRMIDHARKYCRGNADQWLKGKEDAVDLKIGRRPEAWSYTRTSALQWLV